MKDPAIIARHDEPTTDAALEERIEHVRALAKIDVETDRGPRSLPPELVEMECFYEERYTELQVQQLAAREPS